MSLLSRITVPSPPAPEAEDIFLSGLTTLFTDDAVNSWGTPGGSITYKSPRFGTLSLRIPIHPDEDQGRKLFAHYLWNAGVVAADAVETASADPAVHIETRGRDTTIQHWDPRYWDVRSKTTLEIGAATALPSLISALSGATACTITDHPSSPALTAGAIEQNVRDNLFHAPATSDVLTSTSDKTSTPRARTSTEVSVYGYVWGTSTFYQPNTYGQPAPPPSPPPDTPTTRTGHPCPDRIIIADCLWMPSQHLNIVRTILDFLPPHANTTGTIAPNGNAESVPCALVIAGFHTGRAIVRDFFDLATGHSLPSRDSGPDDAEPDPYVHLSSTERALIGNLEIAEIFEQDTSGNRRDWIWDDVRDGESKWEAKRWCVVGVLVRR